jgi:hypothetical protein
MATWHETLNLIVTTELGHRERTVDPRLAEAVKRLAARWVAAYSEFTGATQAPAERPSLPVEEPS